MTNSRSSAEDCPKATVLLEDRLSEHSLEKDDERFLAQHLSNCDRCAAFEKITNGMLKFSAAIPPNDVKQGLSRVQAKREHAKRKNSKIVFASVALAAVLVGAIAVKILFFSTADTTSNRVSPATNQYAMCTPSPSVTVAPGIEMVHCGPTAPEYTTRSAQLTEIRMTRGVIAVSVSPGAMPTKPKLRIQTPHGDVVVKGTIFSVHIESNRTVVDVLRGAVELQSVHNRAKQFVKTEQQGILPDLAVHNSKMRFTANLFAPLQRTNDGAPPHSLKTEAASLLDAADEMTNSNNGEVSDDAPAQDDTLPQKNKSDNPRAHLSLDQYTQQARLCLIDHNWKCAAKNYRLVIEMFPQNPIATTLLVSLAQLELNHLNAPKKALLHFRRYLHKSSGHGPLAPEALYGVAVANQKLGDTKEEVRTLQLFVRTFPNSPYSKQANKRLAELDYQ